MKSLFILWAIAACTQGYDPDDVQSVKSVKGGPSRYIYKGGENIGRFYNSRQYNLTKHNVEVEQIGVCYIEIPTSQLVSDQSHIPAGNGSRPDLSRIRTCCRGFTRNIHDFMVCDPVCSNGCVNALCVAPETCQCYPDYVRNAAGFCTATCPIGCQNGRCSGGECVCDSGYKLDSESKYCIPSCKDNCGSLGNCTAPNTCSCQSGYKSSPEGSCKPVCENCDDGECTAPNTCSCRTGYVKDVQGKCKPHCIPACQPNTNCIGPNVCSPPPISDYSPPYNGSPLNVLPLHPENQVNTSQRLPTNPNQYPNPFYSNYPQGPYYQYPGNNTQYVSHNPSDRPQENSQVQEGQIQQRPDDSFYPNQRSSSYPHPGGQYPQQGNLQNNTLYPSQQNTAQGTIQQPNQYPINSYPGVRPEIYPNRANSSHSHRGDVDSEDDKYPGRIYPVLRPTSPNNISHIYPNPLSNYNPNYQESNSYDAGGRQQNISFNSMNQYGLGSHDSSNQGTYVRGAYNRSQQDSHDFRNQETFGSTQHEFYNTSNQRSYDSSHQHSYGASRHGHQYDTEYTQNSYGNFDRDTQNSSARGQYDAVNQSSNGNSNQDTQSSSNHGTYGSSQQGTYDSSRRDIQNSNNRENFDSHRGSDRPVQGLYPYHNSINDQRNGTYDSFQRGIYDSSHIQSSSKHGTYDSSQQGTYDSSRRDSQSSTNEENYDSRRESYKPNQGIYPYYNSNSDHRNGTYDSSQQGSFDSSRRETQSSTNDRNYDSHRESDRPNQGIYPYYSMSNPRQTPEVSNQVSNQTGTNNSLHTNVNGNYNNFDIEQQTNDVPVCSKPCINGYCVTSYYHNECKCKPGYIADKTDPNVCQPHCPGGCPNGVCSAPRLCLCNVGYHKDTSVKGRPLCVKEIR